ncbi:MAG TPA: ABC transporter permease [Dehalococcoidia bacterium]
MDVLETVRTALEALWANKLRSSLTMLGIVIGVGAVIALMSIGSGAQAAIAANIKSLGSNLITITPGASNQGGVSQGNGSAVTLTLDDANAIADPNNVPDAAAVSPELNLPGNARIVQHGQNISTKVVGVTPAYADVHAFPAVLGAWFTEDDVTSRTKVVMLGANVAQQLFGAADPTGQDISMRVDRPISVHVAGVLQSKGGGPLANVDDRVLMPISTLQRQLSNPRNPRGIANVSQIVVQAASTKSIPAAKDEMTQLLLQQHRVSDPDFVIQSQDDQVSAQAGTTQVLTILLGAIAGISLVVGGIGIMNIMIVSVTERHAGDRHPQGGGCQANGHPHPVPGRVAGGQRAGRADRYHYRRGGIQTYRRSAAQRPADSDAGVERLHHSRGQCFHHRWAGVRRLSGVPGGKPASNRRAEV